MKTRTGDFQAEQSAYLLEYDRRRILNCADTFRSLAAVLTGMNLDEEGQEGQKGQDREKQLRKNRAQEERKNYAVYLRQVAGLMQAVAGTSVQLIRLGGRQERQIVRPSRGKESGRRIFIFCEARRAGWKFPFPSVPKRIPA